MQEMFASEMLDILTCYWLKAPTPQRQSTLISERVEGPPFRYAC